MSDNCDWKLQLQGEQSTSVKSLFTVVMATRALTTRV